MNTKLKPLRQTMNISFDYFAKLKSVRLCDQKGSFQFDFVNPRTNLGLIFRYDYYTPIGYKLTFSKGEALYLNKEIRDLEGNRIRFSNEAILIECLDEVLLKHVENLMEGKFDSK